MPESETPQEPSAERRAEVEAMLEAVKREVVVIHSSKDKCEQLWDALRPDDSMGFVLSIFVSSDRPPAL